MCPIRVQKKEQRLKACEKQNLKKGGQGKWKTKQL